MMEKFQVVEIQGEICHGEIIDFLDVFAIFFDSLEIRSIA